MLAIEVTFHAMCVSVCLWYSFLFCNSIPVRIPFLDTHTPLTTAAETRCTFHFLSILPPNGRKRFGEGIRSRFVRSRRRAHSAAFSCVRCTCTWRSRFQLGHTAAAASLSLPLAPTFLSHDRSLQPSTRSLSETGFFAASTVLCWFFLMVLDVFSIPIIPSNLFESSKRSNQLINCNPQHNCMNK